jgi:hypothetical protein
MALFSGTVIGQEIIGPSAGGDQSRFSILSIKMRTKIVFWLVWGAMLGTRSHALAWERFLTGLRYALVEKTDPARDRRLVSDSPGECADGKVVRRASW